MVPVALHMYVYIWRSSYFFQTLWTDFDKGSLSPVGGDLLDHVTLILVVQGAKCGGMCQYQVQQGHDVSLVQTAEVHYVGNCVVLGKQ